MRENVATSREMVGRPENGTKQFTVQLEPQQVERIVELVGNWKKSEFIREAIDRELKRRGG